MDCFITTSLSLYIRQLFADKTIGYFENIDTSDMSTITGYIPPIVLPVQHTTKAKAKDLLDLDICMWRFTE
jgi:hypothetical protein